jgi:hypothetical protein
MNKSDFVTDGVNYVKKSEIVAVYYQGTSRCSLHIRNDRGPDTFILNISAKEAEMQLFYGYEFAPRSVESVLTELEVENAKC